MLKFIRSYLEARRINRLLKGKDIRRELLVTRKQAEEIMAAYVSRI